MIKKEIRRVILDKLMALGNVNGNLHFSDFSKMTCPYIEDMPSTDRRYSTAEQDIHQHMDFNDDWDVPYLLNTYLDLLNVEDDKFLYFLKEYVNPVIHRQWYNAEDEEWEPIDQERYVEIINSCLEGSGYKLSVLERVGDSCFYDILPNGGVKGNVKNIIFAATYKPEICFSDALNNDIKITKNEDKCLIYGEEIGNEGLSWNELVRWYAKNYEISEKANVAFTRRLIESLDSDPEKRMLEAYYNLTKTLGGHLPALLPQVYLYYDPLTIKQRGWKMFEHQKMDFMMLFSKATRVVIEIDGKQHYATEDGKASPSRYADMVKAQRDMTIYGYEVYRFGGQEFVGNKDQVITMLQDFFVTLFRKHGVNM